MLIYIFTHVDGGTQGRARETQRQRADLVLPGHTRTHPFSLTSTQSHRHTQTGQCKHRHTHILSHPYQVVNSTAGLTIPTPGLTPGLDEATDISAFPVW